MRPVASWIVAKLALPITRLSIMRPATLTAIGSASSASAVASACAASRADARSAGLKSFGKATPLPSAWALRSAFNFSRRSAISWLSSAAAGAADGADEADEAEEAEEEAREEESAMEHKVGACGRAQPAILASDGLSRPSPHRDGASW
ncbi:conserved exported hypothetical protein [Burkholderiales bacterium 8X]|nr:conserved exported hypothetical protein [Burkholderiales bacterium 8X]